MAYLSQERKASLAPAIKAVLKRFGIKGSIGVRHHSTLVVNVTEGRLDLIGNYTRCALAYEKRTDTYVNVPKDHIQVNPYWAHTHFDGECREFITQLLEAMDTGNHDNSNTQIDHHDVGWYRDVNIGKWDKPYCFRK